MKRLYPSTQKKVEAVRRIYSRRTARHLTKDEERQLFDFIEVAARLGRKKNIMTEERIREVCDKYISKYYL